MAEAVADKDKQQLPDELHGMEHEAKVLAGFLEIPSISKAWCQPAGGTGTTLTVQHAQRNLAANAQRKFVTSVYLPEGFKSGDDVQPSFPVEVKDVVLISWSPSGQKGLVARAGSEGNSASLEIWGHGRVLKQLNVPKALHGPLYNDGWFASGAAWSPDEHRVAYCAEAPAPKQTPLWCGPDKGPDKDSSKEAKKNAAAPPGFRGVGEYEEDWGELNAGKRAPGIFVLDLAKSSVERVPGLPEDTSAGQPVWTPDGKELIVTVWGHDFPKFGRRLGIVYCMNRPCSLYRLLVPDADGEQEAKALQLTPADSSAMSARFSPDGTRLIYVSHRAAVSSGTHGATAALDLLAWPPPSEGQAQVEAIVDIVQQPAGGRLDAFPGLYVNALPEQPFLDDTTVLLTTQWRSSSDIVAIDLDSKQVQRLRPEGSRGSWSLLAIGNGWVAASHSAPNQPPQLQLARPGASRDAAQWQWHAIEVTKLATLEPEVTKAIEALSFKTLQVQPTNGPQDLPAEAILLQGQSDKPAPTLVFPHGGPHSAYPDGFWPALGFLCSLGYNILLVNFRGSLGYGEAAVQALPGHIGDYDSADCIAALDAAVALGCVDEGKVAAIGGSHGGLLTGHLVGQYPDRFRCGLMRNPVLDISAMIHMTDIPDWCYVECYGSQEGSRRMATKPSDDELARFRSCSPIAHADNVKCPLCFFIGAKDKRVVMTDARLYVSYLRSRAEQAPETRVVMFPDDTHALDRPQTEFEVWLTHAWWFKQHM